MPSSERFARDGGPSASRARRIAPDGRRMPDGRKKSNIGSGLSPRSGRESRPLGVGGEGPSRTLIPLGLGAAEVGAAPGSMVTLAPRAPVAVAAGPARGVHALMEHPSAFDGR